VQLSPDLRLYIGEEYELKSISQACEGEKRQLS